MNVLDGILGQISENTTIHGLADKFGLTPEQVASAVTALGQAHGQPGDTVQDAADATGLSPDMLGEIVDYIGGERALARFASLLDDAGGLPATLGTLSKFF